MRSTIAAVFGLMAVATALPILSLEDGSTHIIKDTYFKDTVSVTTRTMDGTHYFLDFNERSQREPHDNWLTDVSRAITDQPKVLPSRPGSSVSTTGTTTVASKQKMSQSSSSSKVMNVQPRSTQLDTHNLPTPKQYVTTHNPQTGKAVFAANAVPVDVKPDAGSDGPAEIMQNILLYVTDSFPVNLANDADIAVNAKYRKEPPGLVNTKGSVVRYVDFAPASPAIMHRTVSLDYAVVLEGEIELVLDSGERRTMKRGDVAIQRATMHAWKNTSPTAWARVLFMLQPSVPLEINGQKYEAAVGGIAT